MDPQKTMPMTIRVLAQGTVFFDTAALTALMSAAVGGSIGLAYTKGFGGRSVG